jgi:hypothetical protein
MNRPAGSGPAKRVKTIPNLLAIFALLLCTLGVLIFSEVIRPFRDMSIDGPIALGSWGVGAAIAISCLFFKGRSLTLGVISVMANILPLLAALILFWMLSHASFVWH